MTRNPFSGPNPFGIFLSLIALFAIVFFGYISFREQKVEVAQTQVEKVERFKVQKSDENELVICDTKEGKVTQITYVYDDNTSTRVSFNPDTPNDGCDKDPTVK